MKTSIFWDITPRSPLKANTSFGGTRRLRLQGRRISQARNRHQSRWQAKQMGESCSSETSVDFQRNRGRYIAENRTLHL
jgi:hypothetical protein